ncbi:MAG: response regulator, partial [Bacteroidetes bacterium]
MIEDSDADAKLFNSVLKCQHFTGEIKRVKNGRQALAFFEQYADNLPAVILLDLNLPDINGTDLLRWIKSNPILKRIPIVVWSGAVQEHEKQMCKRLGVSKLVVKPIEIELLERHTRWFASFWNQL